MSNEKGGLRWGVEQRLAFIESRLFWEGGVNRADLVATFDVSVPQASKDLSLYQGQAPNNLRYDSARKRYVATGAFEPLFFRLDANAYLRERSETEGELTNEEFVSAEWLPVPTRRIDPEVLRLIVAAVRERASIEINYQSMSPNRPEPFWRRVSPHSFAHDGMRWHVRAYCHRDERFLDFIASRCLGARDLGPQAMSRSDDAMWTGRFDVVLCPNPLLSDSQQKVVADDYGMTDGQVTIPVRRALLYYFNKRLRLDISDAVDRPSETPAVVKNRSAFHAALAEAMR
ncbi:WYL domain-containing protein [Brevundimonas sp. SH203]|uniref:WYL domain-containing protein n=1 Tax=Brevundimonas sp. SH203 TaxID=345167 RepID=UPI000B35F0B1|nr:WYL domain-containing protein [Brevundimonas sp. SH203]